MAKKYAAANIMDGFNPGNLIVAIGKKRGDKIMRDFCGACGETPIAFNAYATQLDQFVYLVCFPKETARADWETVAITAAHEATHIMQFYCSDIAEDEACSEFQAYLVQSATQAIIDEVKKWRKSSKTRNAKKKSKTE